MSSTITNKQFISICIIIVLGMGILVASVALVRREALGRIVFFRPHDLNADDVCVIKFETNRMVFLKAGQEVEFQCKAGMVMWKTYSIALAEMLRGNTNTHFCESRGFDIDSRKSVGFGVFPSAKRSNHIKWSTVRIRDSAWDKFRKQ